MERKDFVLNEEMPINEAAEYLNCTEFQIKMAVIKGALPACIFTMGWWGLAYPDTPETEEDIKYAVDGLILPETIMSLALPDIPGPSGPAWSLPISYTPEMGWRLYDPRVEEPNGHFCYIAHNNGYAYKVKKCYIANVWYLHERDATELFNGKREEVKLLRPVIKPSMKFPHWKDFYPCIDAKEAHTEALKGYEVTADLLKLQKDEATKNARAAIRKKITQTLWSY